MADCMTDNRNRTVSEIRHAFNKHGGNLGTDGCVAFMFEQRGVMIFPPETQEDDLMEAALEAGADDVIRHDDGAFEVLSSAEEFTTVRDALIQNGFDPADAEVTMRPETTTELDGEDGAKVLRLIERLEDLDDIQYVYTNADIQESVYAEL
jgi:Uncharacterized conserved protein